MDNKPSSQPPTELSVTWWHSPSAACLMIITSPLSALMGLISSAYSQFCNKSPSEHHLHFPSVWKRYLTADWWQTALIAMNSVTSHGTCEKGWPYTLVLVLLPLLVNSLLFSMFPLCESIKHWSKENEERTSTFSCSLKPMDVPQRRLLGLLQTLSYLLSRCFLFHHGYKV